MKAKTVKIKTRVPHLTEIIEVETTDGWEAVSVSETWGGGQGGLTLRLVYDDDSWVQAKAEDINWRRPPS